MISKKDYLQDRSLNIETEGPAVLGQTIVNRLLKAKVEINGRVKIKKFATLGKVIDLVKEDQLKNVRSLYKKHRRGIMDYLDFIGVLEYLGIDNTEKERLCNDSWTNDL